MNSESLINKADFFLREIPEVKISSKNEGIDVKKIVKEELQFVRISDSVQEQILETLKYIYGPDFRLADASAYEDEKSNLNRKFWLSQGNLVVKGACNYSEAGNNPEEEFDRLKQFALFRLESYGFHNSHCIEALEYCSGNIEDSLYLLYCKYFNFLDEKFSKIDIGESELLELREDEKSSLESIYENAFSEKVKNSVWIMTLKLDYLINIYHKKPPKENKRTYDKRKKEKCKNIVRTGHCKYGDNCRFSHEIEVKEVNINSHLEDYVFELEIRMPPTSKYPYQPPLIFLKTNAVLPPLVNLHICKRLMEEAKSLAEDGIPCVYTITELLKNEDEITAFLKEEIDFIKPNERLFSEKKSSLISSKRRISHYNKGKTNKDNKRVLSLGDIQKEDQKIVSKFLDKIPSVSYTRMLQKRKHLPAWNLRKEIVNTIRSSQVVVISGETGCGKSTQVPQYILEDWISNYDNKKHVEIVCTQPRRISAIGVAERVANECLDKIGNVVGYQIRLESKMSHTTRLLFCTTGILLRRLEAEPTLPNVTHIIVDEVHERSEESDFLLLILKELLQQRPDLKVILMSATLNAELFAQYFGVVPTINIAGRTFPVKQYFLEDILEETGYILDESSEYAKKIKIDPLMIEAQMETCDVTRAMPKDNIKDENLSIVQTLARYQNYSTRTCKNLFYADHNIINYELIETTLEWIVSGDHDYPKKGTILIFLPGIAEITTLFDQLTTSKEFGVRSRRYIVLPLHSSLTSEEQAAIFKKPRDGARKIIISTNLAETSITIDDCVYVIDCGRMKEKHFDPNRNMESLDTVWETKANALQRKGRAGRVMEGVCIHLFTSHRFKYHMLPQPIPEIHRVPLEQLILNIKVLYTFEERMVKDVLGAFIEPPAPENIDSSIKRLQSVGAIDAAEDLTPLGHHLAALPVDVRVGKLILYGAIFSCVDAALTMAACLSYQSPFVTPFGKKEEANAKKENFAVGYSDQVTILMAYNKWLATYKKSTFAGKNFARENFMSFKTLTTISDIKHQFLEYLVDTGFVSVDLLGRRRIGEDDVYKISGSEFNKNADNIRILVSILCAALYPNVIKVLTPSRSFIMSAAGAVPKELDAKDFKFTTVQETVFMHPSSINYKKINFPSPFLVYQEKIKTSRVYFRDCTMVPVIPLVLFSGFDLEIKVHNGCTFISLENGWIMFQVEEHKVAEMIKMIRTELFLLLEEKIKDPLLNLQHHDTGEKIISTLLSLIAL